MHNRKCGWWAGLALAWGCGSAPVKPEAPSRPGWYFEVRGLPKTLEAWAGRPEVAAALDQGEVGLLAPTWRLMLSTWLGWLPELVVVEALGTEGLLTSPDAALSRDFRFRARLRWSGEGMCPFLMSMVGVEPGVFPIDDGLAVEVRCVDRDLVAHTTDAPSARPLEAIGGKPGIHISVHADQMNTPAPHPDAFAGWIDVELVPDGLRWRGLQRMVGSLSTLPGLPASAEFGALNRQPPSLVDQGNEVFSRVGTLLGLAIAGRSGPAGQVEIGGPGRPEVFLLSMPDLFMVATVPDAPATFAQVAEWLAPWGKLSDLGLGQPTFAIDLATVFGFPALADFQLHVIQGPTWVAFSTRTSWTREVLAAPPPTQVSEVRDRGIWLFRAGTQLMLELWRSGAELPETWRGMVIVAEVFSGLVTQDAGLAEGGLVRLVGESRFETPAAPFRPVVRTEWTADRLAKWRSSLCQEGRRPRAWFTPEVMAAPARAQRMVDQGQAHVAHIDAQGRLRIGWDKTVDPAAIYKEIKEFHRSSKLDGVPRVALVVHPDAPTQAIEALVALGFAEGATVSLAYDDPTPVPFELPLPALRDAWQRGAARQPAGAQAWSELRSACNRLAQAMLTEPCSPEGDAAFEIMPRCPVTAVDQALSIMAGMHPRFVEEPLARPRRPVRLAKKYPRWADALQAARAQGLWGLAP